MRFQITNGFLVAVTFVAGCATQNIGDGGNLDPTGQAIISAQSKASSYIPIPGNFIGVTIDSIDGAPVSSGTWKLSVSPGMHRISVTCRALGAFNTQDLNVDADAGAWYEVDAVVGGPAHCFSVVERKSKT